MKDLQHIPHETGEMAAVAKLPFNPKLADHLATCQECGDRLCDDARAIVDAHKPITSLLIPIQEGN